MFCKNVNAQIDYYFKHNIDFIEPQLDWDTTMIRLLNIASIKESEHYTKTYIFGPNGKLLHFDFEPGVFYNRTRIVIEYYPNGNMKCFRTFYLECDNEHPTPFCFDLLDDLSILDTNKAEKINPNLHYHFAQGNYWKQKLIYDDYELFVHYQMNTSGEIYHLKWVTRDEIFFNPNNRSMMTNKISFDSSGVISELVQFGGIGNEWSDYVDTSYYMSFINVNGFPRCTKKIIWDGCGGYDPIVKVYEAFNTDGNPGIDTGYFLLDKHTYAKRTNKCFDDDFAFAESFKYLKSGKIETRTYLYPYGQYEYNNAGEIVDYFEIDSIYCLNFTRFLPNQYFEAAILERFTLTYNWMEGCKSCRFPNFLDFVLCGLTHNRNLLYLDEDWINDPNVVCDTSYVTPKPEALSKREHKKWLQEKIEATKKILSDSTKYKVTYFDN